MSDGPSFDLSTSLINVYGPGESGKSNFIKYLLSSPAYGRHLVFDPMKEYDPADYNVYRPEHVGYDGGNAELNMVINDWKKWHRSIRPRYFVVDEAANFLPGGQKPMGEAVNSLAFHNTHIAPGISLITSNRHPTDLNSSIREMFNHTFVFGYRGTNAKRALNDLAEGLTDLVDAIDEYEFVHVGPQGEMSVCEPVPNMGSYNRY